MSVLRVPADALVLLVGVSGSGKTTLAARCFAPDDVLASDAFRARVSGNDADQSATEDAFALLHAALEARMARGLLTVVDATNTQTWARRAALSGARRHGRPSVAIVLDLPLETCLEHNQRRPGRRVPPEVIRRQRRELRRTLADLAAEGHAAVVHLHEPAEADALAVEREPSPGAPAP